MNQALTSLQKLNESQQQLYLESLDDLSEHSEDIAFRAYDLLFANYPMLRKMLGEDRFTHPNLACLLSNNNKSINQGVKGLERLHKLAAEAYRTNKRKLLQQTHKCLIQAVRDVMFIEASGELVGVYAKLLDYRLNGVHFHATKRRCG